MSNTHPELARGLRVLVVSDFPHHGVVVGGLESAVQILVQALAESPQVHAIRVMNFRADIDRDEIVEMNDKLTVHHITGQRKFSLPTRALFDFRRAKKIADEFHPDIVHGQGTGGNGDIAIRLGYPSLVTIHGVGIFEAQLRERNNRFIGPIRVWLTKQMTERVLRQAGIVVSISDFDKEYCYSMRDATIVSIPNAVRKEFFDAEARTHNTKRIVYTGLVIVRKNVLGLVRAFAKVKERVPDAILDIVGPTPDKAYLEEVLAHIDPSAKESIVFHGGVNGLKLVEIMNSASVAVLFSIYENLPCAVAEFLALGKPVVSSRVGAVHEMVKEGHNGMLVESGDEHALADRLSMLLNNDELRVNMGRHGRELALEKWRPERVAEETIRAYKTALAFNEPGKPGEGKVSY